MAYPHVVSTTSPSSASTITAVLKNDDSVSLPICTPVYCDAAGGFKRAIGGGSTPIGVVIDELIAPGNSGSVVTASGIVVNAATAQWDVVCGTSGGLAANVTYYLSTSVAGTLTTSSASGEPVIQGLSPVLGLLVVGQSSGGGGGTAATVVTYVATGSEGTDFNVSIGKTMTSTTYGVFWSAAGASGSPFVISAAPVVDLPIGNRTTTQFRVVLGAALAAGDQLAFLVVGS